MRNIYILLAVLLLFIAGCKNSPKDTVTNRNATEEPQNIFQNAERPIISAHRGGVNIEGYPQNCVETIDYLFKKGINVFEVDLTQTSSGEIILLHDDFLGRTTAGSGKVYTKTDQELLSTRLIDDFGNLTDFTIPTFAKLLDWLSKHKAYLFLDFKKGVCLPKIIELIREKAVAEKCIFIGYNAAQTKKQFELAPEMLFSVCARNTKELSRILELNIPANQMIAFTGISLSEQSFYDTLNTLNIPVLLGTLGNLDKKAVARGDHLYKQWADMGIKVFSTDRPVEVLNAVR